MDLNLMSKFQKKFSNNVLLCIQLVEFMKMAKLAMIQIMGFVKNERTFSTLIFMKTRLWNRLCEHLGMVVMMFAQPFYTIDTFPYDDAITTWTHEKVKKGLLA